MARRITSCALCGGLLATLCFVLTRVLAADSPVGNSLKGFKAPLQYFDPPHQLQVQTYLESSESEFLSDGMIGLKDLKLHTYHENGTTEMIMNSPRCVYDTRLKVINSTGAIEVLTWDDKSKRSLHLEGTNGFYWQQTNSLLIVSNQQSTTISGSLTNSFTP